MAFSQQSLIALIDTPRVIDPLDRLQIEAHSPRLEHRPSPPLFDGGTYSEERDGTALKAQLSRVKKVMLSCDWLSLAEIAKLASVPESTVGSRVRDLRKIKFGGFNIPTKVINRTWYYRIEL